MATERRYGLVVHPEFAEGAAADPLLPENGRRVEVIHRRLLGHPDLGGLARFYPRVAGEEHLSLVHSPAYIELVRTASRFQPGFLDGDTPVDPGLFPRALRSVGAALSAVDAVLWGTYHELHGVFAVARPPGHHATPNRAMGFCYFNNAAIAARYAQRAYGVERVAIVDWDVHHGNGTQEIFAGDPSVLFISLHQWNLWPPGSGEVGEVGTGAGRGFTVNVPLPAASGDAEYRLALAQVLEPVVDAFRPQLFIASIGLDGHFADPLGGLHLSADGFRTLAGWLRQMAERHCQGRFVALLEGGYNLNTLGDLTLATLQGLFDLPGRVEDPFAPWIPVHEDASDAAKRRLDEVVRAVAPFWKPQL